MALFGLGWGASFAAGATWGRRSVTPAAQASVVSTSQSATGAQGQQGQGGQGQGRATAGTVERVEGTTLVVSGPNGQPVRITLTEQTQISRQIAGTAADLAAGARVLVVPQGQPGADGTLTAATVSLVPEGGGATTGQGAPGAAGGLAGRPAGGQG
ncbi:MAG: DUF5666 domain-containing protein, partial [Chloroflexota bacterium]|nr:DUF5666 domain-containing protein [Chloroflexota bacterium]